MRKTKGEARELMVGQLLAQVTRMMGHHLRTHMERLGLHRGQGFALVHLWHHDGVAQREISRAMHLRPASVTNMLQRMELDGWITRSRRAFRRRRSSSSSPRRGLPRSWLCFRPCARGFCGRSRRPASD